jgi:hypothetical protein
MPDDRGRVDVGARALVVEADVPADDGDRRAHGTPSAIPSMASESWRITGRVLRVAEVEAVHDGEGRAPTQARLEGGLGDHHGRARQRASRAHHRWLPSS